VSCAIEDRPFIFISYAHNDAHIVFAVLESIAASGYKMWYDQGIGVNATWSDEIANAILASEVVIVFVTKASMASSYVRAEVEFALGKKVRVIPVYLEGMGVLPPGLALAFHATQGIESNDPNVIVSKLYRWLAQNVNRENWLPAKSSIASPKQLPTIENSRNQQAGESVPHTQEDNYWHSGVHGNKEEYEKYLIIKTNLEGSGGRWKKRNVGGIHAVSSRPYMAKLLGIIFFVHITGILNAYSQWSLKRPFVTALLIWGLSALVFYWYFFRRFTLERSFFDNLLPNFSMYKPWLYWSFLLSWLVYILDLELFKTWLPYISKALALVHVDVDYTSLMFAKWPHIPAAIKSGGAFASVIIGTFLVLDATVTAVTSFFTERH